MSRIFLTCLHCGGPLPRHSRHSHHQDRPECLAAHGVYRKRQVSEANRKYNAKRRHHQPQGEYQKQPPQQSERVKRPCQGWEQFRFGGQRHLIDNENHFFCSYCHRIISAMDGGVE